MSDSIGSLIVIDGANNADSGWLDISWLVQDSSFSIYGTWVGQISLDISDDPTPTNKTYWNSIELYTSNPTTRRGLPRNLGTFIRFRRVSWVSGSARIGINNGVDATNHSKPISGESVKFGQ